VPGCGLQARIALERRRLPSGGNPKHGSPTSRERPAGRSKKVVTKADSTGRYTYSVSKAEMRVGTHRVKARVVYLAGSSPTSRTLVMTLNRCRRVLLRPQFTG